MCHDHINDHGYDKPDQKQARACFTGSLFSEKVHARPRSMPPTLNLSGFAERDFYRFAPVLSLGQAPTGLSDLRRLFVPLHLEDAVLKVRFDLTLVSWALIPRGVEFARAVALRR